MPLIFIFKMNIYANYSIEYWEHYCQLKESAGRMRGGLKLLLHRIR